MPDADLIIIGNGIMGNQTRRAARAAGLSTLVIDAEDGRLRGSRAAEGLIRLSWLHSAKQKARGKRALEVYRADGLLLAEQASITQWNKPGQRWQLADHYAVAIPDFGEPDVRGEVRSVFHLRDAPTVRLTDLTLLQARLGVVVAAGAGNSDLGGPDCALTYGATLRGEGGSPGLHIHRIRPYTCVGASLSNAETRIGSSTTKTPQEAPDALSRLLATIPEGFPQLDYAEQLIGVRAHSLAYNLLEDYEPTWRGRICYAGGLGKIGYALAPAVAEEIIARYLEAT